MFWQTLFHSHKLDRKGNQNKGIITISGRKTALQHSRAPFRPHPGIPHYVSPPNLVPAPHHPITVYQWLSKAYLVSNTLQDADSGLDLPRPEEGLRKNGFPGPNAYLRIVGFKVLKMWKKEFRGYFYTGVLPWVTWFSYIFSFSPNPTAPPLSSSELFLHPEYAHPAYLTWFRS